jgi:hypothetical protein
MRMACLGVHLSFICAVGMQSTFSIFAITPTIFPLKLREIWRRGDEFLSAVLGERLPASNAFRNATALYLHTAGIEGGYGFFAPNVPDNYKIVFELHYADGRTEYEIPRVSSAATGLRLSGLLDQIAETTYEPLRQMMVKILTYSVWQDHPDVTSVRAVFGVVTLPGPAEFAKGQKESYEFLYRYDFAVGKQDSEKEMP